MQKPKRVVSRFLIYVENKGYTVSLEKRKIYVALQEEMAFKHGQVRVIDESGEDYLYPRASFCPSLSSHLSARLFSKPHKHAIDHAISPEAIGVSLGSRF